MEVTNSISEVEVKRQIATHTALWSH